MILGKEFPPEVAACQQAFELASIAAGIVTLDGRPVWFSSAFPGLLGYTQEEFSGQTAAECIHPDDKPAFQRRLTECARGPLPVAERRYRHKQGHYLWLSVSSNLIRDAEGKATHILGIFQDIGDRKRQERELQESKDKLDTILESVKDVVWSFSVPDFQITYMNRNATAALYQRGVEEFYANPKLWFEVVHPDDHAIAEGVRTSLAQGRSEGIYRILRPSGEVRWVHALAWTTMGEQATPVRYEGIMRDVTELKESERLIEAQRIRLSATAKMSALGEMAGGLSHEIINPLAIIHGNALLLEQLSEQGNFSPAELREATRTIVSTTERISKIVHALRAFARDVPDDPFELVALKGVLEETAALCRSRFQARGIRFEIEPVSGSLSLECRPVQISQVLLNLLNNACDAVAGTEDPWIRVSVAEGRNELRIMVTDSGHGIPTALRERIFQPFFTTKEVGKGTGLGLSLSSGIAETHSGSLSIDDTCPSTRFVLTLPVRPSAPAAR